MKTITVNLKGAVLSGTKLNYEVKASMEFMISLLMEFSLGITLAGAGIIALATCAGY